MKTFEHINVLGWQQWTTRTGDHAYTGGDQTWCVHSNVRYIVYSTCTRHLLLRA